MRSLMVDFSLGDQLLIERAECQSKPLQRCDGMRDVQAEQLFGALAKEYNVLNRDAKVPYPPLLS